MEQFYTYNYEKTTFKNSNCVCLAYEYDNGIFTK